MKRKPYTVQEREELLSSWAIIKIRSSSVTYNPEFKVFAVKEYFNGKAPMQIFLEAGINVAILGKEQPQKCLSRWRNSKHDLLTENRGKLSTGRQSNKSKELTIEQVLQENAILKEQVAFLKKLRGWK